MPQVTLRPTGTTSSTDFPPNIGGTAHGNLSDGADSSYISRQAYAGESHYAYGDGSGAIGDMPLNVGKINYLQSSARAQGTSIIAPGGGATLQGGPISAGGTFSNHFGGTFALRQDGGIQNFSGAQFATSNFTGLPWGAGEINALGWYAGASGYANDGDVAYVFELSFLIDYQIAPGGFAFLLASWLGPLVAVGLAEMPKLAAHLYARSSVLLRGDELRAAWRELREAPNRRYCFA